MVENIHVEPQTASPGNGCSDTPQTDDAQGFAVHVPAKMLGTDRSVGGFRGYSANLDPQPTRQQPLLNALVNTSSGATWVSIHHGGGVGIGRSIHAGQVSLADGTDLAAEKLERVLSNDPATGVIRHVDAGYDIAADVAAERGVRVPMSEG